MIKERISKLLTIRSLITLTITALVVYMSISGKVEADKVVMIYTTLIGFYFGTQKKTDDDVSLIDKKDNSTSPKDIVDSTLTTNIDEVVKA